MNLVRELAAKFDAATAYGARTTLKRQIAQLTGTSRGAVDNWLMKGNIEARHHKAVIAFIATPLPPEMIRPPKVAPPVRFKPPPKDPQRTARIGTDWKQFRPWFSTDASWLNAMQLADRYQRKGWHNRAFRVRMNLDWIP